MGRPYSLGLSWQLFVGRATVHSGIFPLDGRVPHTGERLLFSRLRDFAGRGSPKGGQGLVGDGRVIFPQRTFD